MVIVDNCVEISRNDDGLILPIFREGKIVEEMYRSARAENFVEF